MFQKYTQLRTEIEKVLDSYDQTIKTHGVEEISNEIAEEIIVVIENKYGNIFKKENPMQMTDTFRDVSPVTIR